MFIYKLMYMIKIKNVFMITALYSTSNDQRIGNLWLMDWTWNLLQSIRENMDRIFLIIKLFMKIINSLL